MDSVLSISILQRFKVFLILINVVWFLTTIIGLIVLLQPYVKLAISVKDDYKVIVDTFQNFDSIKTDTQELEKKAKDHEKILNGININKILSEKSVDEILGQLSNVVISSKTIEDFRAKKEDDFKNSIIEDINNFGTRLTTIHKPEGDIAEIYANIELVGEFDRNITLLAEDLKSILGENEAINEIIRLKDKIMSKIYPLIDMKKKYNNFFNIIFIHVVKKKDKDAKISYGSDDLENGIILMLHSCYYFDINVKDMTSSNSFADNLRDKITAQEIKSKLFDNQDVKVILKQDGESGKDIDVCPNWGKNQKGYIILFGIIIVSSIILFIAFINFSIMQCCGCHINYNIVRYCKAS
uniref:4HB_MCP_1 domain-containing protein n=1 Tax=Strongyloides papillosus TaxID=174720 RepID=A0A0N5B5M0_STREA